MERTFKQTIDIFSAITFGSDYEPDYIQLKGLNDFVFITLKDFVDGERLYKYPLLMVTPTTTSVPDRQAIIERNFTMGVLDLVKPDRSNLIEVYSDTEQIIVDIIRILRDNFSTYECKITNVSNLEATEGTEFEDDLAGFFCEITFQIPYINTYCKTNTP